MGDVNKVYTEDPLILGNTAQRLVGGRPGNRNLRFSGLTWITSGHCSVGDGRDHGTYRSVFLCDLKCPNCLQVGKSGTGTDFYLSELFVGSIPIQDIDPSFIVVVLPCVGAGLATG
jgi:hypothetical protein